MKVTYLEFEELSGDYREFRLEWPDAPSGAEAPLNFNQRNHRAAFRATGRSTWIGGIVQLPDDVATDSDVAELVQSLVDSSDALRSVAVSDSQQAYPPGALTVVPGGSAEQPPAGLEARIDSHCLPGSVPGLFFARVGDQLLFAADHFHADMMSVALLADRIHGAEGAAGADGDDVGFLETLTEPPERDAQEDALSVWSRFFQETEGKIPPFPVDLGVGETGPVEPVHDVRRIADAEDISGDLDTRTFAVLLGALAAALEPLTGTSEFPVVIPVHTRGPRTDPRRRTVGWMVSNAPVIASADDPGATLGWLRQAMTVARLPLETMVARLQPTLPESTVPMVSYVDFRRPGEPDSTTAYVSAVSPTDTVQFWFSRQWSGIDVRTKYPDTRQAREAVEQILHRLRENLRS